MKIETWQHCYDDSWKGLITNDAFAHPAKMARGLVRRIFDELFAMDALRKGEVVLDPFGGVGTTGIEAASRGVQAYLVELEGRFVNFAEDNFVLHEKPWALLDKPRPIMLQGDSRKLREVLVKAFADCLISSPPYAEPQVAKSSSGVNLEKQFETYRASGGGASFESFCATQKKHSGEYGSTDGQLGQMPQGSVAAVVSSPPYSSNTVHGQSGINLEKFKEPNRIGVNSHAVGQSQMENYGQAGGQLGAMPAGEVDAVVSSPPYTGDGLGHGGKSSKIDIDKKLYSRINENKYGEIEGQLGNKDSETFWSAARDIVLECHAVLKPGGVAVWVVKDFVRNKKRVRFSDDWIKLCEACGFKLIRHAHAMLVKETRTHDLFGEEIVKKVERKSFFRRLHEQKLPADDERRIDHEDVVFFVKN